MSWDHIQAALRVDAPRLSAGGRHVLLVLAVYSDVDGRAWPAAATVADLTGLHRSTVLVLLRQVVKSTGVKVVHRPGRPAVYDLSKLVKRASDTRTSARVDGEKRARSPHRNSYVVTDQGDDAATTRSSSSPRASKGQRVPVGSVDYSRYPNWTRQRLEKEAGNGHADVIDLSFLKRLEDT